MNRFTTSIILMVLLTGLSPMQGDAQEEASIKSNRSTGLNFFETANAAYNQGLYGDAVRLFIESVQQDPGHLNSYRNLARSYFWLENYAAAATAYGHYLRLAQELKSPPSDQDAVSAERRLALARSNQEVLEISKAQKLTLGVLQKELDEGRAYSPGGGGAWYAYQTLLRTGFANPDLIAIRARLGRRLLDEFEALLLPEEHQITPLLELEDWEHQRERIEAAGTVAQEEALQEVIARRRKLVEAVNALLQGERHEAGKLCQGARAANPDLRFASWFEIVSLIRAASLEEADQRLDLFMERLRTEAPEELGHADLLKVIILQRTGRHQEAAQTYLDILSFGERRQPSSNAGSGQ
jgi:hypothetical protein